MKDDVKMVQGPPSVDVDGTVINRSTLVFIWICKLLTKCNVCCALDNLFIGPESDHCLPLSVTD